MSPLLRLSGVHKTFGRSHIIRGVDLTVGRNERHALIGPNGAGKSTLFGLISGRIPLSKGEITFDGQSIVGLPPARINRRGISRSFQITNIFPGLTVFENVLCAVLSSRGESYRFWRPLRRNSEARDKARAVLKDIGLDSRSAAAAGALSYSDQRALELGLTIAGDPRLILLDEPAAGMNRSETAKVIDLVQSLCENRSLLVIEHDMSVVFKLAQKLSVLVHGEVIASGAPEEVRGDERVKVAYLGSPAHA